jgi:hypothetical protein
MKILLLAASFVLASPAAHAQSAQSAQAARAAQAAAEPAGIQVHAPDAASSKSSRRDDVRPRIDHSMDRLVVEPTHSTVTLTVPSPAAIPARLTAQSRQ